MQRLKIEIIHHHAGDHRAILTEYQLAEWNTGEKGVTLTGTFANAREVEEEFSKIEAIIAKAKAKALRAVDPVEAGVRAAQRTFGKVLEKADPKAVAARKSQ